MNYKIKERYSHGWIDMRGSWSDVNKKLISTVHCVDIESLKEKYHAFKKMLPNDQIIEMEGDCLKIYVLEDNAASVHYKTLAKNIMKTKESLAAKLLKEMK